MADPKEFAVKTREDIREDYTRTVKAGLEGIGFDNVNVSSGTLDYVRGDALGAFGEDIGNLVQIKANAQMPDTAGTSDPEDLRRLARIIKRDQRPAGPSIGSAIISTSVSLPVAVPTGAQLLDASGLSYEVLAPGPYLSSDLVPIRAIDTGTSTNLEAGTTLRWASPPPFVNQTAIVSAGGLRGGVDQETIEGLRQRVIDYYRNPPGGGNWSHVADVAEKSSTFVQRAFVYPGVYGGNTLHVAVVGAPTATNKTRAVAQLVVDQTIAPFVIGAFPGFADIVVTSVIDVPIDVSMGMSIPTSRRASPPGPGGGWIDGNPWPLPDVSVGYASVVSVASSTSFVIHGFGTPIVGGKFVYVSPVNFKVYKATIVAASQPDPLGFPNNWLVSTDVGIFSDSSTNAPIGVGDWVFPDAERVDAYITALLGAFAELGPSEKTSNPGLLPRALRQPLASYTAPSQMGPFAVRRVVTSGEEVYDASFLTSVPALTPATGYKLSPTIAIPAKIAFYPE